MLDFASEDELRDHYRGVASRVNHRPTVYVPDFLAAMRQRKEAERKAAEVALETARKAKEAAREQRHFNLIEQIRSAVPGRSKWPIIADIIDGRARRHGVTISAILGRLRGGRPVVRARHEAMHEIWLRLNPISTPTVGRIFGRDHSTVCHAIQKIERELAEVRG